MPNFTKLLNNLFNEWENTLPNKEQSNFIRDGIVNEQEWNKQNCKILFILKEPNDPENNANWDLRKFLSEGADVSLDGKTYPNCTKTFGNLCRWAYGILNNFCSWDETQKYNFFSDFEFRKMWLNKIAVMNVKKSGGESTSSYAILKRAVQESANFIRNEIQLIKPDIIITGSTGWYITDIVYAQEKDAGELKTLHESDVIGCIRNDAENWMLFDYYHPDARSKSQETYYTILVDTVKMFFNRLV